MTQAGCPFTVIAVARTDRRDRESTPVQSALNPDERGTLEFRAPYEEGLAGLAEFDHAWLLSWLGGAETSEPTPLTPPTPPLRQVPFLLRPGGREMGVFATRGPRRVNPIGLSLVRILEIAGRQVRFAGVDLVDGTPIIDVKPYVTRFDRPPGEPRCGWFDSVPMPARVTPAELTDGSPPPRS
jgi:tRNA-Thr(GGU) m(6)t(6)A37 methyltransferase TsaA